MDKSERYDRQVRLFGAVGQEKITSSRVAIFGLGGLGSHIAQQLAYLGVGRFLLVDHDTVSVSSLNRLIGAFEVDAITSGKKVETAKRMIEAIQPEAEVTVLFAGVESAQVATELSECDAVFGCFDNDLARLILVRLAMQHELTYFDLATDTGVAEGELWFGGRLAVSAPKSQCLLCMGLLDQKEIARESMGKEKLEEQRKIYGVEQAQLGDTGPSVVSLNGLVASLAVTEFMTWITGIRSPHRHLVYRGEEGKVRLNADKPEPGCFYCQA
jgi:molybdopterin/thiamine biosynthesis adenylyltransferase